MSQLSITNIAKSFGAYRALEDISLEVNSGEFICVLGASGCGKTTLLRMVAGLETPDSGTIKLNDEDLTNRPCHERNIGMVFQSLALFPHLNVGDNISYGPKLKGMNRDEIENKTSALLKLLGLEGFKDRAVSALSGGQKQRVAIARALAIEPDIFLMDEPFSALDAGLRDHLQIEVKRLQQELGITTLFVTHDQREAMALADRIVIMNAGRIEQVGSPAEVYSQPANQFVAEFIGDNNFLKADLKDGEVWLGDIRLGKKSDLGTTSQGRVTLAIRPEHIQLSETGSGLEGQVTNSRLLGATRETLVKAGDLEFRQTSTGGMQRNYKVGDCVSLSIDLDSAWILPS